MMLNICLNLVHKFLDYALDSFTTAVSTDAADCKKVRIFETKNLTTCVTDCFTKRDATCHGVSYTEEKGLCIESFDKSFSIAYNPKSFLYVQGGAFRIF